MQVRLQLRTLPFTLDSKGSLWRALTGGVTCFQMTHVSAIFDFFVTMNICCFCNQEKSHQNPRRATQEKQTSTSRELQCQPGGERKGRAGGRGSWGEVETD